MMFADVRCHRSYSYCEVFRCSLTHSHTAKLSSSFKALVPENKRIVFDSKRDTGDYRCDATHIVLLL